VLYKNPTLNEKFKLAHLAFFLFCAIVINYIVPQEEIFEFKKTFGWFIFTLTGFLLSNSFIPYYYNHLCVRSKVLILVPVSITNITLLFLCLEGHLFYKITNYYFLHFS
jgi:hypothetical protein